MNGLREQLNDLYQLQMAAREIEHGVNTGGWKLFKPSKFVYAFFTFNTLYSINWKSSKAKQILTPWELGKEAKTESQKIREMRKYIYYSSVRNDMSDEQKRAAKEAVARVLKGYLESFMESNDVLMELSNIKTDGRINEGEKDRFIKNFSALASLRDTIPSGKKFNDAWDNILSFVFAVRNNIFHGSKTVLDMLDSSQQKRLDIYTAVLLATNEMLFEAIERDFDWTRQPIQREIARRKDWIGGSVQGNFRKRSLSSRLQVRVPEGRLFYPCCGDDTLGPLRWFMDSISEFHFVDIQNLPGLPRLDCASQDQPGRGGSRNGRLGAIRKEIVSQVDELEDQEVAVDPETLRKMETCGFKLKGLRESRTRINRQEWTYEPGGGKKIRVCRYIQDGLTVFLGLDEISVFFLRKDSMGESGSGQMWFQKGLFDLILDKLLDGGLIVTDGSGLPMEGRDDLPYRGLWKNHRSWGREAVTMPEDFQYMGRTFRCLGEAGRGYGPVYVWQVERTQ